MSQSKTGDLQINDILLDDDSIASEISNQFNEWSALRSEWLKDRDEVLRYVFATDTAGTANAALPWKNSTHIPKICQIRDNLHANYKAALFPTDRPYKWEGSDDQAELYEKKRIIEGYMHNKLRQSNFRQEVDRLLLDYIDYGNCFATIESVYEQKKDPISGKMVPGYIGPRLARISPADIVFNPAAKDFQHTSKIIRSISTLGALQREIQDSPEKGYLEEVFKKSLKNRASFRAHSQGDFVKDSNFQMAGFSSWYNYFTSDYVEVLDFYGDIYNPNTGELELNQVVTVIDRHYVIRHETNPSWNHFADIFHVGWRVRQDNLMAMGPLDNLVGMQYRIDHLENAKADGFDLIIHPVMKVTGYVEDFVYGPGEHIYVGDEGDVSFMSPDSTVLAADTQIDRYEAKMEEMAGAPKQAMGFRTPGEKTKYEVQVLENGANKVFINKTAYFEEMFLEKILNAMLMDARRNLETHDVIRVVDTATGAVEFMNVTPEDLKASGKIYPIGARRYARDANLLQTLTQLASSPLMQDPSVRNHISGKALTRLLESLLDVENFGLFQENIGIAEQMEAQQVISSAQQILGEQGSGSNEALGPEGAGVPQNQPPQQ